MGFVENLIFFLMVRCENRFTFERVITDYVMSSLYGSQCIACSVVVVYY